MGKAFSELTDPEGLPALVDFEKEDVAESKYVQNLPGDWQFRRGFVLGSGSCGWLCF